MILGEDCGSLCERRQPDFAMEKTSVQQIWGSNGKAFSNFLEDVVQPTQRHLSSNHDSDVFVSHNMINLLSRDQPGRMPTLHKCGYGSLSDTCVVSSDESHSTGGFVKGNFPVPQATFHNPPLNTSYLGTCQSKKPPYQKEYSNREIHEFRRSFETDCHPTSRGRKGWYCTLSFSICKYILPYFIYLYTHTHSWPSASQCSIFLDSANYID